MTTYRDAESFAARLDAMGADPRRNLSGPWWTARCIHPDHTDDTPSMTFKDGDTALVVHCFACSPNGHKADWLRAVMAAAEHGDPLPPAAPSKRRSGGGGGARGARVAAYDYTDPQGRPVARKVRYEPKTFAWERPYGEHWSEGLAGTPLEDLPLYGLRSLTGTEPGAMVGWCEGEKDTDRLAAEAGIPAVCSAASGTWPRDLSPLTGMHVQIVADNDAAGIRHALGTGDRLAGIAASITYWAGAERGKGADLSDHFDAGHGLGDLIELHRDGDRLTPIQGTPADADAAAEGSVGIVGVHWAARTDWPDPVPFITRPPTAALPEGVAGTLIGDLADMVHDSWGVQPLLTVHTAIGVAAAATRGAFSVGITSGATFPLALYLIGLADPGSLKSPLLAAVAAPLHAAQAAEVEARGADVAVERMKAAGYGEAIKRQQTAFGKATDAAARTKIEAELRALHQMQQDAERASAGVLVVTPGADPTYEALITHAADNGGRIAALSAEGALIENLAGRYSDGAARTEFLNSAYDGEPFTRQRIGGGTVSIPRPWATLLQVVQPDVFATMLGNEHMARRGFLQRFWFASIPPAAYRNRHDLPALDRGVMARWSAAVAAVWQRAAEPATIGTGDGLAVLRTFEAERIGPAMGSAQQSSPLLAGWLGKAAMTSVRVGAVMQLTEAPASGVLGERAGTAAAGYGAAMLEHATHLFTRSRQSAAHSPRGRVLAWLAHPDKTANTDRTPLDGDPERGSVGSVGSVGGVSTRDVLRRFQDQAWCRGADDARAVLSDLAALGWLDGPDRHTTDKGGRPSEVWQPHPDLARHYRAMAEGGPR